MKILKYLVITYVTQAVCARLVKDIPALVDECERIFREDSGPGSAKEINNNERTGPLDRIGF